MFIPPAAIAIGLPIIMFGALAIWDVTRDIKRTHPNDHPNNQPLHEKEILDYYKKFDLIYDIPPGKSYDTGMKKVEFTFLGLCNEEEAVVFDGKLEDESELEEKTYLIKKVDLENLLAYTNIQAEVRKEEIEGAKAFCELQDSEVEKERKRRFHKKTELESLNALPCDMVERTTNRINERHREVTNGSRTGDREDSVEDPNVLKERRSI